jgi:hypothetical protein
MQSRDAAEMRWLKAVKDGRDMTADVAASFIKDLVRGVELFEAMQAQARKLGDTLIDMGVKSLVNQTFAAVAGGVADPVTGATAASGILAAAGASIASQMVAGATSAAAILGIGGATAGAEVAAGGTVAGVATATGGATAGSALAAGGAAAGSAIWGPLAAVAAIAAGVGLSFLGQGDKQAKELEEARKRWKDMTDQVREFTEGGTGPAVAGLLAELQALAAQEQGKEAVATQDEELENDRTQYRAAA